MRAILKLFVSLRLAVWALVALTVLAMIGTLVPQNLEPGFYLQRFGNTLGPWLLRVGIADLYHSPLFVGVLSYLLCSAFVCTWMRVRFTHRRLMRRLETVRVAEILYLPTRWQRADTGTQTAQMPTLPAGWRVRTDPDGRTYALRTRGGLALLGGGLIHVGLVIILIGGMVSAQRSVEFMISGTEKAVISLPQLSSTRAAVESDRLRARLRQIVAGVVTADVGEVEKLQKQISVLDEQYRAGVASPAWRVRLDQLWVDEPEVASQQNGTRHWNTAVTVTDAAGTVLATDVIRVNSPGVAGDYTLYQANWGKVYPIIQVEVWATDAAAPGSWPRLLTLPEGRSVQPDWSTMTFQLSAFYPDLRVEGPERFYSASDELHQPAAQIEAFAADGTQIGRAWAFSSQMAMMAHRFSNVPGYRFAFVGAVPAPKTGLQVGHDPGTSWVWVGAFLMSVGLGFSFYVRYLEEWILFEPGLRLTVAVGGNRPPPTLRGRLEALLGELGLTVAGAPAVAPSPEQGPDHAH